MPERCWCGDTPPENAPYHVAVAWKRGHERCARAYVAGLRRGIRIDGFNATATEIRREIAEIEKGR